MDLCKIIEIWIFFWKMLLDFRLRCWLDILVRPCGKTQKLTQPQFYVRVYAISRKKIPLYILFLVEKRIWTISLLLPFLFTWTLIKQTGYIIILVEKNSNNCRPSVCDFLPLWMPSLLLSSSFHKFFFKRSRKNHIQKFQNSHYWSNNLWMIRIYATENRIIFPNFSGEVNSKNNFDIEKNVEFERVFVCRGYQLCLVRRPFFPKFNCIFSGYFSMTSRKKLWKWRR